MPRSTASKEAIFYQRLRPLVIRERTPDFTRYGERLVQRDLRAQAPSATLERPTYQARNGDDAEAPSTGRPTTPNTAYRSPGCWEGGVELIELIFDGMQLNLLND